MNNGKIKFYIFSIIYFILVIADGVLTYIGTPDLTMEANPLVSVFGLGWIALFVANCVVLAIFVLLTYHAFIRYKSPILYCDSFKQFCSMLYFNRPDKFIWMFYKIPKTKQSWSVFLAIMGYAIAVAFPVARLILVLEWIGYLTENRIYRWYNANIRTIAPYDRFDIFVVIIIMIFVVVYWHYKEYKINKTALEHNSALSQ